ncbi:hypothetical protein DXG03_004456 [Asterophora parasitica]|uniref:Uncharacterized protein n=1 Tax=Asterophora parasitica TaxID=117018 RepID=A0A9P7G2L6_9AGAR|nr:hypothetical protein DXG03_004456 [Asterophora parasitica]
MAVPIQQLAVHLQNTVTHLQLASGSLNAIAAAPPPNLGGTPQWVLDMIHENKWEFYVMKIMNYNSSVDLQEQVAWSLARNQNATLNHDVLHLTPICLPLQRLAVPAIPSPPVPGALVNPPPIFVGPAPGPAPAAHASFPVTLGDLRTLTLADLALLFPAYNIPQPNGLVAVQRAEFAHHVGKQKKAKEMQASVAAGEKRRRNKRMFGDRSMGRAPSSSNAAPALSSPASVPSSMGFADIASSGIGLGDIYSDGMSSDSLTSVNVGSEVRFSSTSDSDSSDNFFSIALKQPPHVGSSRPPTRRPGSPSVVPSRHYHSSSRSQHCSSSQQRAQHQVLQYPPTAAARDTPAPAPPLMSIPAPARPFPHKNTPPARQLHA